MPINASHVKEKSTFYINYRQPYASVTPLSAFSCGPSVKETMTCWTYESEPLFRIRVGDGGLTMQLKTTRALFCSFCKITPEICF